MKIRNGMMIPLSPDNNFVDIRLKLLIKDEGEYYEKQSTTFRKIFIRHGNA